MSAVDRARYVEVLNQCQCACSTEFAELLLLLLLLCNLQLHLRQMFTAILIKYVLAINYSIPQYTMFRLWSPSSAGARELFDFGNWLCDWFQYVGNKLAGVCVSGRERVRERAIFVYLAVIFYIIFFRVIFPRLCMFFFAILCKETISLA